VVAVCAVTVGITGSLVGRSLAKHHTTKYPDTENVYPAEREFQQVGIEYARQTVLDAHTDPEPSYQSPTPEQQKGRYPHPKQQRGANETQLNGDMASLIMRMIGYERGCPFTFDRHLS